MGHLSQPSSSLNYVSSYCKMDSKKTPVRQLLAFVLVLLMFSPATCDIDKDKERCENALAGVATCLPYVSGEAKSPPIDCCSGLKQVLQKSPECICLLVKDRNDPNLGLKINATLALSLPSECHAPANISHCPALLHLPPNSPDAKVFEDFAHSGNKSNSLATSAPAAGNLTSGSTTAGDDGGNKKRSLGIKIVSGLLVTIVVAHSYLPEFFIFS